MTTEILEAASSLVFAASRCGEFSELSRIRKLMGRRFGSEFERVNVELLPGNCVNSELRYNLGNNSMLKEENPQILNKIGAELHKTFSGEICDQEKEDNFNRKIDNKEKLYELKIKNMINRIGSKRFPSFNSTHSATIHVDIDSSSSIEDMEREDEESKAWSSYVHPKLPDYDDLVVTFTEYKKERLMKSDSNNNSFRKWMRW